MSINNSNDKVNNFKIEKQNCDKIIFESPTIEKNTLVVLNDQFLSSFSAPRYNCKRVLVSGKNNFNDKPFNF